MKDGALGIGAVSRLTGIPAPTLRTWEMRYGRPVPERGPGGQRLYAPDVVHWLKLVQAVTSRGVRVAQALQMSDDQLQAVLGAQASAEAWMECARDLDPATLDRLMLRDYARLGGHRFVTEACVPFLRAIGDEWALGRLGVHEEHMASGCISAFVNARWRALSAGMPGAPVVVAALPNELHMLGLELAALVLSTCGLRVSWFGSLPIESLLMAIDRVEPVAVVMSISDTRAEQGVDELNQLADALLGRIPLFVGGAGAPHCEGTELLVDFDALRDRVVTGINRGVA